MTQQQLIETVKQHHPQLTNAQIRIFLNTALKEFTRKSRILTNQTTFTTTSGQRYYPIVNIDSRIHEISKVSDLKNLTDREGSTKSALAKINATPKIYGIQAHYLILTDGRIQRGRRQNK